MPTGDPVAFGCQCPTAWWGVVPPPCPVHNPQRPTVAGAGAPWMPLPGGIVQATWPAPSPPISDADVERIAARVAAMLRMAAEDKSATSRDEFERLVASLPPLDTTLMATSEPPDSAVRHDEGEG